MRSPRISAGRPTAPATVVSAALRRDGACSLAMADRGDRGQDSSDRCARSGLTALQDTSARAADVLASVCRPGKTPPRRRARRAGKRLDTMLQAVKQVRTALDDFYATLSDEQKAQFETIGPTADFIWRQIRYDAAAQPR